MSYTFIQIDTYIYKGIMYKKKERAGEREREGERREEREPEGEGKGGRARERERGVGRERAPNSLPLPLCLQAAKHKSTCATEQSWGGLQTECEVECLLRSPCLSCLFMFDMKRHSQLL